MASNFTLNVLGTASALPTLSRYPSAQVLEVSGRLFLIDCGEGAQVRMKQMGISIVKIEAIFLSHLHGDHVFGIFGLLSTMSMLHRQAPLRIFAPEAFGDVLDFYRSHFTEGEAFEIKFTAVGAGSLDGGCGEASGAAGGCGTHWPQVIYETSDVTVSAFPLKHGVPTFGYLFREKMPKWNIRKDAIERYGLTVDEIVALKNGEDIVRNPSGGQSIGSDGILGGETVLIKAADVTYKPWTPRSFAYCSDTMPFPELAGWVRGVDLLYHEATYPQAMQDLATAHFHSTTIDAARCAAEAGADKLIVGHYSSRFQDVAPFLDELRSIFPESYLTNDCDIFDVPALQ